MKGEPEMKNNTEQAGDQTNVRLTRRGFLKLGLGTVSAIVAVEAGTGGFLYLRTRSLENRQGGIVVTGKLEDFPHGSVTEFAEDGFYLMRTLDGGFLAIYRRCPHLGCTVNWEADKERYYCPCHASSFDAFGTYEGPPVPRSLDLFEVYVENGEIIVDTSRIQQREQYSPDQLVYA
jgi:cytochrome b6-f complex iron-sulfur subunit